jgi:hypothetical protein
MALKFAKGVNIPVRLFGARPEIGIILQVASGVFTHFGKDCVVTGMMEGKHGANSLHYVGLAVDLRKNHIDAALHAKVKERLIEALPIDCDVVVEKTHFHIEFQPHTPYDL